MSNASPVTQVMRVRDAQYKDLYSNSSITQMGPFDISLIFQKMTEIMPGQTAIIDQVSITFSPQHFKALVRSLVEAIDGYESAFGKLSIPDSDTVPNRTAADIATQIDEARKAARPALKETDKSSKAPRKPGA